MKRRQFLGSTSALFAAWALGCRPESKVERLGLAGANKKFVFVFVSGGWDTTRVFSPKFGVQGISMESGAATATVGNLRYVQHPDRPEVDAFFQNNVNQTLVVEGLLVPSLAHEVCTRLLLTGSTADSNPDMPAIIASRVSDLPLPQVVINGPTFPGDFGTAVTMTGSAGQLDSLIDGSILDNAIRNQGRLPVEQTDLVARHVRARTERSISAAQSAQLRDLQETWLSAQLRADALKQPENLIQWNRGFDLTARVDLAVEALSKNLSRCVSFDFTGVNNGWDSHSNNDVTQSQNFKALFAGLNHLMEKLQTTSSSSGTPLSKDTVVVVFSEMNRTPGLNGSNGKDHWAYTSAMIVGPGVAGNRVIGGFDDNFNGLPVDFASGDVTDSGAEISSASFCAGLLNLADIDHQPFLPGVASLASMIL